MPAPPTADIAAPEGTVIPDEQRDLLKILADSPRGVTEGILATHGLAGDLLAGLVRGGFASVASETAWCGTKPIEIIRVRITEAGRRILLLDL